MVSPAFFAIIGLGFWAARIRFFSAEATAYITRFVFYFALSAMLFRFAANLDFAEVFDGWQPQQALQHEVSIAARMLGTSAENARLTREGKAFWQLADAGFAERLESLLESSEECALTLVS